jgi:hypothetical protein
MHIFVYTPTVLPVGYVLIGVPPISTKRTPLKNGAVCQCVEKDPLGSFFLSSTRRTLCVYGKVPARRSFVLDVRFSRSKNIQNSAQQLPAENEFVLDVRFSRRKNIQDSAQQLLAENG